MFGLGLNSAFVDRRISFTSKLNFERLKNPDLLSEVVLQKKSCSNATIKSLSCRMLKFLNIPFLLLEIIFQMIYQSWENLLGSSNCRMKRFLNIPFFFLKILRFSNDVLKMKKFNREKLSRGVIFGYFLLCLGKYWLFKTMKMQYGDLKLSLEGIFDYFLPILEKYWLFRLKMKKAICVLSQCQDYVGLKQVAFCL